MNNYAFCDQIKTWRESKQSFLIQISILEQTCEIRSLQEVTSRSWKHMKPYSKVKAPETSTG